MEPSDLPLGSRARLESEREQTISMVEQRRAEVASMARSAMTEGRDDEHDPDGATVAFEHAMAMGLLASAEAHLSALDAALDRLARGTYSLCVSCGEPISAARLSAEPAAPNCLRCAAGTSMGRPVARRRPR